MSQLTDAFEELLNAQEEVTGVRLTALFGLPVFVPGPLDAIVEEITFDEVVAAGGLGEKGGYRLQMLMADFVEAPQKNAPVTANGVSLQVLQVIANNGIYIITCGDPVGQDEEA